MAEAFVAQNPDCAQPNHPAQIRLKSGSSRPTDYLDPRLAEFFLRGFPEETPRTREQLRAEILEKLNDKRLFREALDGRKNSDPSEAFDEP
jgi:hypothetical protein